MKYRNFSDVAVAEVGLGTWQLGGSDWGVVDEGQALELLQEYVHQGGNFIDTADVYGMGHSESLIGKFRQNHSGELFIASKLGRRNDNGNGWPQNFTYQAMKTHVEQSLERLGVDQLFLEQLHCIPTAEMQAGRVFDNLRRLQQDGLIRHWGASVESAEEARLCLQQQGLASLQVIFNLFRQHISEAFFDEAAAKQVAVIVRVPLASGLLSGKLSEDTVFDKDDHRNYNANGEMFNAGETFSGIPFQEGIALAREIAQLMPDDRLAVWALRWILDHPQVTTVIPGASKMYQVRSNMAASDLSPLPADVHSALRAIYDEKIRQQIRGVV